MSNVIPDMDWYATLSQQGGVQPRCPFATVKACPRFYASLLLLGEAGGSTTIEPRENKRLKKHWEKTDLWPRTAEQDSSYFGRKGHYSFSNFCPEVSFERFGYFASGLYRYSDDLDTDLAHERLGKEKAPANDPRWAWVSVTPLHYTECPLYSVLVHRSAHSDSRAPVYKWLERIKNHPFIAVLIVLSTLIIALATLTDSIDRLAKLYASLSNSQSAVALPVRITRYEFAPLVVGQLVTINTHILNSGPATIKIKGVATVRYVSHIPSDPNERAKLEDGIWTDFMKTNVEGIAIDFSVPPNVDIYVPNVSGKPLSAEVLKGLGGAGAIYLMGWAEYLSGKPQLNFCVSGQYVKGTDNPPRIRLCVEHN